MFARGSSSREDFQEVRMSTGHRSLLALSGVMTALVIGLLCAPLAAARTLAHGGLPIAGATYAGHTSSGERVTIRIAADDANGAESGILHVACAAAGADLRTADGAFTARWKHGGHVATGVFDVGTVSGHVDALSSGCPGGQFRAKLASPSGVRVSTLRYGPDALKPMPMGMPMPKSMFNMDGAMQDFWSGDARPPCADCYIVGVVPNFVYPDGKVANYDTGAMMHHIVLFDDSAHDVSCPVWPQRIMASGNERTDITFPRGYGYYVGAGEHWSLLAELMSMSMRTQQVEPQLTYYWVPASHHLQPVTPLWLDENECGNSLYSIPKGSSDTVSHYTVPASIAGPIVSVGGHVHDYGIHISLTDTTTHTPICDARAGYGMNMAYMKNIESMSGCTGTPVATIHTGDVLSLNSFYTSPIAENDVMGIMIAYVATHHE
jgi:hypothetical protein